MNVASVFRHLSPYFQNLKLHLIAPHICGLCILVYILYVPPPPSSLPCACLEDVYSERSLVHTFIFQPPYEVKTDAYPLIVKPGGVASWLNSPKARFWWMQRVVVGVSPPTGAVLIIKLYVRQCQGVLIKEAISKILSIYFGNTWSHLEFIFQDGKCTALVLSSEGLSSSLSFLKNTKMFWFWAPYHFVRWNF